MMKLFISWSGSASLKIALLLRDWIPDVIQGVKPFVSTEEIRKGQRWPLELAGALEELKYGVLCMTPNNLTSPWITFEAGALSKSLGNDMMLSPILFGVKSADDLSGPLGQFQATKYEMADMRRMMRTINGLMAEPMEDERFTRVFRTHWKELKKKVDPIVNDLLNTEETDPSANTASPELTEILDLVRSQQRVIERATGDNFWTFRGNARLEPLTPGDYRQLALGYAMLKELVEIERTDSWKPDYATLQTFFKLRDPLDVILARAYAPHIHSLYFDDRGERIRMTYVDDERDVEEPLYQDDEDTAAEP